MRIGPCSSEDRAARFLNRESRVRFSPGAPCLPRHQWAIALWFSGSRTLFPERMPMGVSLDSSPMAYRGYRAAFGTEKPSDLRLVSEKKTRLGGDR